MHGIKEQDELAQASTEDTLRTTYGTRMSLACLHPHITPGCQRRLQHPDRRVQAWNQTG